MKKITNKTVLKQGDKTYQPVEVEGVVYWVGKIRHMTEYVTNGEEIFKPSDLPEYSTEYAERYWERVVAQSFYKLEGVPVVSLKHLGTDAAYRYYCQDENTTSGQAFHFTKGYEANPNTHTQRDIEKAIELARVLFDGKNEFDVEGILGSSDNTYGVKEKYTVDDIIEQLSVISTIEVDEQFSIISYE